MNEKNVCVYPCLNFRRQAFDFDAMEESYANTSDRILNMFANKKKRVMKFFNGDDGTKQATVMVSDLIQSFNIYRLMCFILELVWIAFRKRIEYSYPH